MFFITTKSLLQCKKNEFSHEHKKLKHRSFWMHKIQLYVNGGLITGFFFLMAIHKDIHCFLLWFMSRLAPFRTSFLAISVTREGLAACADIAIFPLCSLFWTVPPAPQPDIPQKPLMMPFLHHLLHGPSRTRCFCRSFQTNLEIDTAIKAGDAVVGWHCVTAFLSCMGRLQTSPRAQLYGCTMRMINTASLQSASMTEKIDAN